MTMSRADTVRDLMDRHGATYAEDAGITLRDKPSPLYELLVLTTLFSVPIKADVAVAAARELFTAGWRTPERMLASTWQQRVDALGRGHYKRYDESTATYLAQSAQRVVDEYGGDLRRMRERSTPDGKSTVDVEMLRQALREFPRIGETGAHIFCREVQVVWPDLRPYFDSRALDAASHLGLPTEPGRLGALVRAEDTGTLAAALVRAGLQGE
jgi:hypothetical protein